MARNLNGSTDRLSLGTGALAGMTHGTYAAIFRVEGTGVFRTLMGWVTSGGAFVAAPMQVDTSDQMTWESSAVSPALPLNTWLCGVMRKASGTVNPRFSLYRYDTGVWSHALVASSLANHTALGATDQMAFAVNLAGGEVFDGDVALMACWENFLPWSADVAGDVALEQAGLQWDLLAWLNTYSGPPSVAFVGAGTRGTGTTITAPPYPAGGNTAGNQTIAFRVIKPSTATATDEAGWTNLLNVTGGTGTQGIDVGPQRLRLDRREEAGGAATPSFDQAGTPNSVTSALFCYSKNGGTWDVVATSGDDNTHGTGRSATGASIDMQPGDVILILGASDTDDPTAYTNPTISATGFTFTTPTQRQAPGGSGTGQDVGSWAYEATVLTGSGSAAPTFSVTAGPSSCGRIAFVRLRAAGAGAAASPPSWLCLFDQSDVTQQIIDLTGGGGNQVSRTGTTVSTTEPPGFGYGADPIVSPGHAGAAGAVTLDGVLESVAEHMGALSLALPLTGVSNSVAEHTAALSLALPLAGVSNTVAEHIGVLGLAIPLVGISEIVAEHSGALSLSVGLTGVSNAVAEHSGAVSLAVGLLGVSNAVAEHAGALSLALPLVGTSNAVAEHIGALGLTFALTGTSDAVAEHFGQLGLTVTLQGTLEAVAEHTGDLTLQGQVQFEGLVGGVAEHTGSLTLAVALAGVSDSVAEHAGALELLKFLDGTSLVVAEHSGTLSLALPLVGASNAVAEHSGVASLQVGLSGVSNTVVELVGDLGLGGTIELDGLSNAVAEHVGDLSVGLSVSLVGTSNTVADVIGLLELIPAIFTGRHLGRTSGVGTRLLPGQTRSHLGRRSTPASLGGRS